MKLINPRLLLIAGLALALDLGDSSIAHAAGGLPSKSSMVARTKPTYLTAQATPPADVKAPPLSSVPAAPVPDATTVQPRASSGAPTPLAPAPATQTPPVERPPLGLHYGEQERLDAANAANNGQLRPIPAPQNSAVDAPAYQPVPSSSGVPMELAPTVNGSQLAGPPVELSPTYAPVDRFTVTPPPGTLGQTYKRRTSLIPDTKHPRVGIVEVHLPENVDVSARGLKVKWTGKVWRLESDPLVPGVPHIYEITASYGEGTTPQVRTVRLIMGRVVDVEF
jgi:hypothetical protein